MYFLGLFDAINEGKEISINYFKNWNNEVKTKVPDERLLVFNVKDGWEPLCKFLNLPIPDGPFPNTNDSKQMKRMIKTIKIVSYCLVFGLVPIVLVLYSSCPRVLESSSQPTFH